MTTKNRNFKGLSLAAAKDSEPPAALIGVSASPLVAKLSELEVNTEYKLSLKLSELEDLAEIGAGNGGHVSKARHRSTNLIVAHKVITVGGDEQVQKQILRELQYMDDCSHKNIVSFYGAFFDSGDMHMCMEFMDTGSLDKVYHRAKRLPEAVAAKIAYEFLQGYNYLYDTHKIIHRGPGAAARICPDVKPSNILLNSKGEVKLCDFGVSNVISDTVASGAKTNASALLGLKTFVGTSYYMSVRRTLRHKPERIQGLPYTVNSDSWSLGLTLMEVVTGRFPFPPNNDSSGSAVKRLAIFELISLIVQGEPPTLPGEFSPDFQNFCKRCLDKNPKTRWTPSQLAQHPWIKKAEADNFDLAQWFRTLPPA